MYEAVTPPSGPSTKMPSESSRAWYFQVLGAGSQDQRGSFKWAPPVSSLGWKIARRPTMRCGIPRLSRSLQPETNRVVGFRDGPLLQVWRRRHDPGGNTNEKIPHSLAGRGVFRDRLGVGPDHGHRSAAQRRPA